MKCCSSCKQSEIENDDTDGKVYIVHDPDTGKIIIRGYLCKDHLQMYDSDGYMIKGRGKHGQKNN